MDSYTWRGIRAFWISQDTAELPRQPQENETSAELLRVHPDLGRPGDDREPGISDRSGSSTHQRTLMWVLNIPVHLLLLRSWIRQSSSVIVGLCHLHEWMHQIPALVYWWINVHHEINVGLFIFLSTNCMFLPLFGTCTDNFTVFILYFFVSFCDFGGRICTRSRYFYKSYSPLVILYKKCFIGYDLITSMAKPYIHQ